MITLRGKLKKDNDIANSKNYNRRVSVRDKLLIKEVNFYIIFFAYHDNNIT